MTTAAWSARRSLRVSLLALWFAMLGAASGAALAVDANTASVDELQTIRGIGPAMAARIVEARQREPFHDLDDLRSRVRGIGEKNLRKMSDAGLEVGGGGQVIDAPGRAQLNEAAPVPRRTSTARPRVEPARPRVEPARPRVEQYVGRPR